MRRRLFNFAAALSLVLGAAMFLLWTRSMFAHDGWLRLKPDPSTGCTSVLRFDVDAGRLWVQSELRRQRWRTGDSTGWQHYDGAKYGPTATFSQWCSFDHADGATGNTV